jgi:glutaredoxin
MNGCPWCEKAEELLRSKGKNYDSIPGVENPDVIEKMKKAGRLDYKYWPKIFHNNKFIGGYSDLEKRLK